ncbi:glutamic acid-rich protein-like [Thunnus albacares]|uniref:glutamic acid-rich protein-like n=1 Tax=Thunnus albacares TaxID=8236 RepID=UPI001CF697A6|nr:glutamic acid-rich protein-like [Thunnus albacares]
METKCGSQAGDRKKRFVRRYTQEVEQQLSTLKELTAAILSYSNNQFTSSQFAPSLLPPLHLPAPPNLHCPTTLPFRTTQKQLSQELLVQLDPQWLPAERKTEQLENQPGDKKEEHSSKRRIRLDLFLQIPSVSRTPTPQMEPQLWVHHVAMTPEEPEEPQTYLDLNLQHSESSQHSEINHHSMGTGGEIHHPNMNDVRDAVDDRGCSTQRDNGTTSIKGNYERSVTRNRHGRIVQLYGTEQPSHTEPGANSTSGLLLPPLRVGSSVCHGPCWENTDRPRWDGPSSDEHHVQRLPPIAESLTVAPRWAIQAQTQSDAQTQAESQENQSRLHQQPLLLPLLLPMKKDEEITYQKRGGREKTDRQYCKQETGQLGRGGRLHSEKGSMILLEPGEEPPPPVGVLGCVAGRRGPGRQSSLAFLQNRLLDLQDPCESTDANRGMVRGILPLELRDLQNGRSVGSLILGPDGEIIQLSLYDNNQDSSQGDDDKQEQALQVLSAEGEKLPWVILLQPEHTHTEGEVEMNTDVPAGDTQHYQSIHKRLDLHRSTETDAGSTSRHTLPVAENKKKTKCTEAVVGTQKEKKDSKKNVRMPSLRELVREPRGGNAEAEEEEEEEQLYSTGQTDHLSGSHQPGEKLLYKGSACSSRQSINLNEATTEDAVEGWKRSTKRNNTGETAITTGKREMKTGSTEADGQKELKKRRGGKWQRQKTGSDAQPIRSQKQEERTKMEAVETQDHSALPSLKKKMRDREGERGKVKTNEERDGRGELTKRKGESTGRRRRARLKHKELVVGRPEDILEKEELELNQEMEEESHLKSTRSSFATQRQNETNRNSKEDADHLSTDDNLTNADKHSSVRSASSCRSTVVSQFQQRSSQRSDVSSCEGAVPASTNGLASSRSRLSSCSTVMIKEEQLMLNPVKPESSRARRRREAEEAAALRLAQRAERRRQEVERKRKEEEFELERLRLEEEKRQEEESKRLQEMDESERIEYLRRKEQEEEERRNKEEERKRREEEAALWAAEESRLQAELLTRQMALLQQQLAFKRGLLLEAGGLEKTQGISRPWIYSYFTLLQLLGLNPTKAETTTPDL